MLSLGEQQRSGDGAGAAARARLPRFLDEATASLDEPAEAALYTLIEARLPNAAIVSIGHRSTLTAFHKRRRELTKTDGTAFLKEAPVTAALR